MTDLSPRLTAALADRYRIERELGAGGMATVYLAEDLKHHRKVAVKVLRPELAAALGPERFVREIEIAAGLHHPHILGVFDSGEAGGFLYYVMPHVEGESLRARLAQRGELPIHDAVKILLEVVDALAHAHTHGVVHRDIKPDNVLLSGRHALVTDFGVAKAVSEATGRQQLTTAGVALGTPAYMAPEQAAADPHLDQRVDIYAVGALGYELVTGRPPFTGRNAAEVLAAHLTQPPADPRALRLACPPALAAILLRCLEKRPADRWQSAEDLLAQLEPLATPSTGVTPAYTAPVRAVPTRRVSRAAVVGGAVAVLAALAVWLWPAPRAPRVAFGQRTQVTRDPGLEYDPAISPDGRLVAYTVPQGRGTRIVVRQVDGSALVMIARDTPQTQVFPAWAPDNRRLLFLSERGIEVIPALGGATRVLVQAPPGRFNQIEQVPLPGAWSPDGREIAYALGDSVFAAGVETGARRLIATAKEAHSFAWSADGGWIAFVSGNTLARLPGAFLGNIAPSAVWVVPARGGAPVAVAPPTSTNISPAWLPDGRGLLFLSDRDGGRDVYAVSLARDGTPASAPARVTTGLGANWISVSSDGRTLTYASFTDRSNVWSVPIPSGAPVSVSTARAVTRGNQVIENVAVSPDGRWIVFDAERGGRVDLYRMSLPGGEPEPFVAGAESEFFPRFSPDGRQVAYHAVVNGRRQLFIAPFTGGPPTRVTHDTDEHRTAEWLSDSAIVFMTNLTDSGFVSIATRGADGRWGPSRPLTAATATTRGTVSFHRARGLAAVARTGDLVIVPERGGDPQLVLRAPEIGGYSWVAWSGDGSRIFFLLDNGLDVTGVWSVPAAGGRPRLHVRFDDPTRPWHRFGFLVHGGRFYFTLGELESDVWTAEVKVGK